MHLITAAHAGEAQSIIEFYGLERKSPSLYTGATVSCLITGEGPFEASIRTSAALASGQYTSVINIGICGTLSSECILGEIYPVRTSYLVIEGKPQYKSFPAETKGMDLITTFERILHPEKAEILKGVGQLVDREAWGVGLAAKEHGVPFRCFKLVSDEAGTLGACEIVREKAAEYSQKLTEFLLPLLSSEQVDASSINLGPEFHFTFTTSKKLENLLSKISIRTEKTPEDILGELDLGSIKIIKVTPKERASIVLDKLEQKLDPFKGELKRRVEGWKTTEEKKGMKLTTDPSLDSALVRISIDVSSPDELQEKIKTLKELDLNSFYQIREGVKDVE